MKKQTVSALLIALGAVAAPFTMAEGAHHWGYTGDTGPGHWGDLSQDNFACKSGKNQSPVDITGAVKGKLKPVKFDYQNGGATVVNNGHSIQVNYKPGSFLTVNGHQYELKQFHFHSPSENWVNGKNFPMEGHLVHMDKDGNLAVVAVMFKEGAANPVLEQVWSQMPAKEGEAQLKSQVSAADLLPKNQKYYRFTGSLTTPPCSEGVTWIVMKNPVTVSHGEVASFEKVMNVANNRPVQPLNARVVIEE